MKNFYTNHPAINKTLLSTFFVVLFQTVSAQNLVTNSGFENGTTGWNSNCSMEIYSEPSYGGTNNNNNVTEIDVERCFNQQVCVLAGLTYTFTYKATRRPQGPTAASVGMTVKVTGVTTNTNYVNVTQQYTDVTFNLQTNVNTFTIAIPANSTDKKLNIQFNNYNNTGTYGVVIDDIQLAPAAGSTLSINGPAVTNINMANNFSVTNIPASGVNYNWNFGSDASQVNAATAAPGNIIWTATGNKAVSVALSNSACTVTALSSSIVVVNLLSVKMISFTGTLNQHNTELTWVTENETDNKFYVIERSSDDQSFDSIGVTAGMNNFDAHTYHFTDKKILHNNNYYRLKQVNKDGSFTYSKTVVVKHEENDVVGKMQLYPNPAAAVINYTISSTTTATVKADIYNATGVLVKTKTQELNTGINQQSFAISELPKGTYFLKVAGINSDIQFVQAFIKAQ